MILTTQSYWENVPPSVRAYWRNVAAALPSVTVCTHRPNARTYRGEDAVRRCSTGGKWGKSPDIVRLDISALLAAGYIAV